MLQRHHSKTQKHRYQAMEPVFSKGEKSRKNKYFLNFLNINLDLQVSNSVLFNLFSRHYVCINGYYLHRTIPFRQETLLYPNMHAFN